MKILAIALAVVALTVAASPPPAAPLPAQPQYVSTDQYGQVVQAYQKLSAAYQAFQASVYAPYCTGHGEIAGVALIGPVDKNGLRPAWPAVVSCKDGYIDVVKSPLH